MLIKDKKIIILNFFAKSPFQDFFSRGLKKTPKSVRGSRIIRGKRSSSFKKIISLRTPILLSTVSLIYSVSFSKRLTKFFTLLLTSDGTFLPNSLTIKSSLFSYFFLNLTRPFTKLTKFLPFSAQIIYLKNNILVNSLQLDFGKKIQYALASGVKAKIISISSDEGTALIELPSSEVKVFSAWATCKFGPVFLKEKKKIEKSDWRLKRLKGFKPVVRGIAMNPVDHPHGGKKKSVRFPRNPWGKAAKKK